jgi:TFIIF-interacting CTD phosphatase-like protein
MSHIYEIVLFTAGHSNYAEKIIAKIDPKKRISHVLCRDHCIVVNGSHYMKNIRSEKRYEQNSYY